MSVITVLGIDLAKNVFQLHGVDERGKVLLRCQVRRSKLMEKLSNLPRCIVAMEACGGAHHWGREFVKLGHEVRLISPKFVKPYVKTNKNDRNDAEAIVEAATRAHMRFVPIKGIEHQDVQSLHRMRRRLVVERTALINEVHSLSHEYGVILPLGPGQMRAALKQTEENEAFSPLMHRLLTKAYERMKQLDEELKWFNEQIDIVYKTNPVCQRLAKVEGIGPVSATALFAAIPDPNLFKNGRQFSASLGLVPKQHSTGGKTKLLGISKRGDIYVRTLLIHGARSVVRHASGKTDSRSKWITLKDQTRGRNKTCVAVANKNARIVWALLANKVEYQPAA